MDWIQPMEPIAARKFMNEPGWIHQIKWDGIRGLSYIEQGQLQIFTKNGRNRTAFYPELSILPKTVDGYQAILDGELVILGDESRPTFQLSLIRERIRNPDRIHFYAGKYPVVYILFDLLALNGRNLTNAPLLERRKLLKQHIEVGGNIALTDDFHDPKALFNLMKERSWEGIVSKRADSRYLAGKHHTAWYKIKIQKKLLTVVWGILWKEGFPNSLVLGIYRDNVPAYVGRAAMGLTQQDLSLLKTDGSRLITTEAPFKDIRFREEITWLKPALTCWISFLEWTRDGVLRHPKILGFSSASPMEADGREWTADECAPG